LLKIIVAVFVTHGFMLEWVVQYMDEVFPSSFLDGNPNAQLFPPITTNKPSIMAAQSII